jgi:hypothetical protein
VSSPDSSPTSGANDDSILRHDAPQNVSPNLTQEAVRALAVAGQALLAIANALGGGALSKTTFCDNGFWPDAPKTAEVIAELLRTKARAGKCDGYLRQLRMSLKRFAHAVNNAPVQEVLPQHIERWLGNLAVNARTKKGNLDSVRLMFNFALKRGYVRSNPALEIQLPKDDSHLRAPEIHTPEQVAKVLHTMQRADLDTCRFLAVRYFAGLRGTEAQACNVQLERGFIEVTALAAKTRRRRLVKIEPNLAEWLKLGGELPLRDLNTRLSRVGKLSGVPWSANVTRHSFCSYHLARFRNAASTALEAGHSEAMLFAHYRELVTEQDAAEFWSIVPTLTA